MQKYRVIIQGHNFLTDVGGSLKPMGFLTEVFVEAGDEDEAEELSIDVLRHNSTLRETNLNGSEDRPTMSVKEIEHISSFEGCKLPHTDLAFYIEDHDARRMQKVDDAVIAFLATTNGNWRKVAMVFARVTEALSAEFPDGQTGHELFDRRIEALVSSGQLVAKGDITKWRFSEVRLP